MLLNSSWSLHRYTHFPMIETVSMTSQWANVPLQASQTAGPHCRASTHPPGRECQAMKLLLLLLTVVMSSSAHIGL